MPTPCESWPARLASTRWPAIASASSASQPALDVALVPLALAGVGGLWLATYLSQLRALPLLPLYNPWEGEGAAHGQAAHH